MDAECTWVLMLCKHVGFLTQPKGSRHEVKLLWCFEEGWNLGRGMEQKGCM